MKNDNNTNTERNENMKIAKNQNEVIGRIIDRRDSDIAALEAELAEVKLSRRDLFVASIHAAAKIKTLEEKLVERGELIDEKNKTLNRLFADAEAARFKGQQRRDAEAGLI